MNTIGKRRLLKLADILDVADAEHRKKKEPTYDQTQTVHECGTPACALGRWAVNNRRRFKVERGSGHLSLKTFPMCISVATIGQGEFGISYDQGAELFGAEGCGNARTAKQAAGYIRKFVKRIEREQFLGVPQLVELVEA